MARQLRPLAQLDFSGGVNLVVSPYLVGQKQVADASNLISDEHGSLHTRDGSLTLTTSPVTNQPIRFRGILNKVDGTEEPFAIQSTGTVNRLFDTTAEPWTAITPDFTTDYIIPDVAYAVDQAFIAPGHETPKLYDGTSLTNIVGGTGTVPAGAKHAAFHLGAIWIWNTDSTTGALDGPSSLRASATNDPNDWPNANQTFVSKDDGQVGMGMSSFTIVETGISPTATLVLFKNYSTHQVTDVFGGAAFSVQRIKSDMGCISPRTIQFVSGFGVIRLSHKGFALYNGVEDRLISEEVRPAIFGGEHAGISFTSLDFGNIERSWSVQSQNPPLYVTACPVSGTTLTRVFIYDLIRRSWSLATFPLGMSCLNLFFTPTTSPVIHAGTATTGKILQLFNDDETDDGSEIDWSFRTRAYYGRNPLEPTFWRRARVLVAGSPRQLVKITPRVDRVDETTRELRLPSEGSGAHAIETSLDVDLLRTARHVQLNVSGSGHAVIRAVELHASPKPIRPELSA